MKGIVLQSTLNYSHVSHKGSILVRVGEMSTAFGSFMLRYDDTDNALSISLSNTAITMRPSPFSESRELRSTRRKGNGTGGRNSPTPPLQIRAASSLRTNTATGPAAVATPSARGFVSAPRATADHT